MTAKTRVLAMCLATCLSAAAQVGSRPVHPQRSEIEGQVFIVTKGQQTIRLALVEVSIFPEAEVRKRLATVNSELIGLRLRSKENKLASDRTIKQLEAKVLALSETQEEIDKIDDACRKLPEAEQLKCWLSSANSEKRLAIRSAQKELETARIDAATVYEQNLKRIEYELSSSNLYRVLLNGDSDGITSTTSDVDGKFIWDGTSSGRVLLVARSHRLVFGGEEKYEWAVWLTTGVQTKGLKVLLANHNLLSTSCNDCLGFKDIVQINPEVR